MMEATCIRKIYKNSTSRIIVGYELRYKENGADRINQIAPDILKEAIRNKRIAVDNLKLTSDNKLISTNENKDEQIKYKTNNESKKIDSKNKNALNVGYTVGHSYYRYLDPDKFGIISNDIFTVGHRLTTAEKRENKLYREYQYMCHKDINILGSPELAIGAFFKNIDDTKVRVDFKLGRRGYISENALMIVGYIFDFGSLEIDTNTESEEHYIKKIADKLNELGPKLYDIADCYQSLYSLLPLGAPIEEITKLENNRTDIEMLTLAISRITSLFGDKTDAEIDKKVYGAGILKVLYKNNVSDDGNTYKIVVTYKQDEIIKIDVINKQTRKPILNASEPVHGRIKENSKIISKVVSKMIIKIR